MQCSLADWGSGANFRRSLKQRYTYQRSSVDHQRILQILLFQPEVGVCVGALHLTSEQYERTKSILKTKYEKDSKK